MMLMSSGRSSSSRFPFTASQWQELEHQALVFKYIVSGIPIPSDLLFTIRTSLDSSKFLIHQPQHTIGWNSSFQMGFGRKIDPEPGRCRRTDGKKWRCSKEAYPDSKYCERHMHRGRNRSRKPVEILSPSSSSASAPTPTPTPTPLSESHFLYPHFPPPSTTPPPPPFALPSQQTPNFFLHPKDCTSSSSSSYGHGHGMKGDHQSDDHTPLTLMASSHSQIKHHPYSSDEYRHHHNKHDYYYDEGEREEQPKKVMHHFLDEWAPNDKDSEDKTQLSISIPNSLHDFFVTQK
ncbi:hypothetical protein ACS0TY_033885 [Phlomoides rotata]